MAEQPTAAQLRQYLDFARELAREAGAVTLHHFRRKGLAVESKADASPVTVADRETELHIRRAIEARWPDHGILGEEFGETNPGARLRWIIDPIDGTKAFIHGVPLYTVLLALECDGDAVVGVIHNPPQDETAAAARGLGCTLDGEPCHVSGEGDLARARVQCTNWAPLMQARPALCGELLRRSFSCRTWADAYGYLLVASGRAEVMVDAAMSLWDMAALKPVIEEAGGRFSDLSGNVSIHSRNAVATNGLLHEAVLELARRDG